MPYRFVRAACALALCLSIVTGAARAAPVTMPLNYSHVDGDALVQIVGSVTFDDSIWTPNQSIFDAATGLIAVTLQVSGPSVPGGSTTYTIANVPTWVFVTDAQNRIIDLNFFGTENASGCFVNGFEVFLLGFYCDPEDDEDYVALKALQLTTPSNPVPTLDPALLALSALLLAASAAAALRRRR